MSLRDMCHQKAVLSSAPVTSSNKQLHTTSVSYTDSSSIVQYNILYNISGITPDIGYSVV